MVELLYHLAGGKEFYEGNAPWESVGVAAIDDYTIKLFLGRPTPYFLSLLANPIWFPVQRKCLEDNSATLSRNSCWTRPGKMVSNGPYVLSRWRVGDCVLVKKNPNYWRQADGAPDAVAFYPIGDSATEQNAFENGELDITITVPPDRMDVGDGTVHEVESLGVFYYLLRCDRPPLDNVHMRRAMASAIDREQVCRLIGRDPRFATGHLVPPGCNGHVSIARRLWHNPQTAKKVLSRAACGGAGQLSISVTGAAHARLVAQAVQEMWRQELAMDVGLRCEEWKSFLLTRRSGNFTVARGGWIGDYDDPTTFLNIFRSGCVNNFCRWSNGCYDAEMEAADGELDPAKRRRHLQNAEAILLGDVPIIPLYYETNRHRVAKRVSGWNANKLDYHLWQNVRLNSSSAD
jgi:oligopeptide transport system substrate-binding protein